MKKVYFFLLALCCFYVNAYGAPQPKEYSFYVFTKADRLHLLEQLQKRLKEDYSLLEVKERRKIIPPLSQLFALAKKNEEEIGECISEENCADANLKFYDRIKRLIAEFKDTHFHIREVVKRPAIFSGLVFREIQGNKIAVSEIQTRVFERTKTLYKKREKATETNETLSSIDIGDELISIDGRPVEEAIQELLPYVSGSSEGSRRTSAIAALTQRNFAYPQKNYALLALNVARKKSKISEDGNEKSSKQGDALSKKNRSIKVEVRLPYFYSIEHFRKDAVYFLDAKHYLPFDDLTWSDAKQKWQSYKNPISPELKGPSMLLAEQVYYEEKDKAKILKNENYKSIFEPFLRTGYFTKKGKLFGYIQFFRFHNPKLFAVHSKKNDFIHLFRDFVKEAKEKEASLVIDLRKNHGGDAAMPSKLLRMLIKEDETLHLSQRAFPSNKLNFMLQSNANPRKWFLNEFTVHSWELILQAWKEGKPYTNLFELKEDAKIDPDVGGYPYPVAILITPSCVSACDGMSIMAKSTPKSFKIIGTHASGTGAGFLGSEDLSSEWTDDLRIVSLRTPNTLFGYPKENPLPDEVSGATPQDPQDYYLRFNSENVPVVADHQYIQTLEDIQTNGNGWLEEAAKVLLFP